MVHFSAFCCTKHLTGTCFGLADLRLWHSCGLCLCPQVSEETSRGVWPGFFFAKFESDQYQLCPSEFGFKFGFKTFVQGRVYAIWRSQVCVWLCFPCLPAGRVPARLCLWRSLSFALSLELGLSGTLANTPRVPLSCPWPWSSVTDWT